MKRYARHAGSSEGFTLLEVIVASAILATSAAAIGAIFLSATRRAADTRDLTIATSVARNAVAEALSDAIMTDSQDSFLQETVHIRPSLTLSYQALDDTPIGDEDAVPLTNSFIIEIDRGAERVVSFAAKRAVYVDLAGGEENQGDEPGDEK